MYRNLRRLGLALAFITSVSLVALAQGTTSRVTGVVTDSAGAPVSGATVTLRHEGTGATLTAETGDSGTYTFDLVQPGQYEVTVQKVGFKKFISQHNTALVNQPATVSVTLEPGDVSATVTVSNTAEQVQTSTSGNLGTTVEQRTLEALPIVGLRGRNPLDLLNFQPGVVSGANTGGGVHVNGSRDRAFNFTLDGIDINESTSGGSNFTPLRPNPDSVQEFQIVTTNATAELGRSSGAQVTLVTRSGTNNFHGNLFDYYQTPRFNAKSYPLTIAKLPKDQFVQHIYGGSFGGPLFDPGFGEGTHAHLMRNKAFFFVNLQLLRAYDTALVTRTVYTPQARAGLFRYVVGRANAPFGSSTASVDASGNPVLPACTGTPPTNQPCITSYNIATQAPTSLDNTLLGYLNAMPLPNNYTAGDGLNTAGFNFASPQHEKQYDLSMKFDFKFNSKNQAYVRWAQGSQSSLGDSANTGRPIFPNTPNIVDTSRLPRNLAINDRWSPTAVITNEALYGRSTFFFKFATPHPDPNLPFSFVNVVTPNVDTSYNARGVLVNQWIDNLTYIHGSHTIKIGINFRFQIAKDDRTGIAGTAIEPQVALGNPSGFTGYNLPTSGTNSINTNDLTRLQNMIADEIGRINTVSQAFVADPNNPNGFLPAGSRWINRAKYNEYDYYGQDNWRVRPNIILDLGLRYERRPSADQLDRPLLVPNRPVKLGAPPSNSISWVAGKLFPTRSNWEPSVGLAWDPFRDGKTSIRGNYRLATDRFATFLFGSSIFQSTPGNALGATNSSYGQAGGLYRNIGAVYPTLIPSITPGTARTPPAFGTGSISVIDPDLRNPEIHEFALSFQREIFKGNVFEFNWIRKHAVHLEGGYNVNQVNIFAKVPGQTESFLDAFNNIRANAAYNSPLINLIMSGSATNNGGTARFRALNSTQLSNLSVATAALTVSQRTCQTADVTAGICANLQIGQRLLDLNGFSYLLQPYPQFTGGLNVFDSSDYSNYTGLEFIFKRRMQGGLSYQVAYTWSKSKDNRSWDPSLSTINTANSQAGSATPFDLRNRNLNYTYSDFDRRHVIQGTYVYELPLGRGKHFNLSNHAVDAIISSWQLSGTTVWMSGRPFTVYSGQSTLGNVIQSTADCTGCTPNMGHVVVESGVNYYFTASQRAMFTVPAPGSIGNTGRNFFRNAPYFQTDLSLSRRFKITERWAFEARVDARNLTNHPSFDISASNSNLTVGNTAFGRILDGVANSARRLQVSGKISF